MKTSSLGVKATVVVVAVVFFFLIQIKGCSTVSYRETTGRTIDTGNFLLTYIRMPVTVDNERMTMSTLIRKWYDTKNKRLEKVLIDKTQGFIDALPFCSRITITTNKNLGTPLKQFFSNKCDQKHYYYVYSCRNFSIPRNNLEELRVIACVEESRTTQQLQPGKQGQNLQNTQSVPSNSLNMNVPVPTRP